MPSRVAQMLLPPKAQPSKRASLQPRRAGGDGFADALSQVRGKPGSARPAKAGRDEASADSTSSATRPRDRLAPVKKGAEPEHIDTEERAPSPESVETEADGSDAATTSSLPDDSMQAPADPEEGKTRTAAKDADSADDAAPTEAALAAALAGAPVPPTAVADTASPDADHSQALQTTAASVSPPAAVRADGGESPDSAGAATSPAGAAGANASIATALEQETAADGETDAAANAAAARSAAPQGAAPVSHADHPTGTDQLAAHDASESSEKTDQAETDAASAQQRAVQAAPGDAGDDDGAQSAADRPAGPVAAPAAHVATASGADLQGAPAAPSPVATNHSAATAAPAPMPAPAPPDFAQANHARIVTSLRTQLLPGGGTMQIRLDPPELGAMQVIVRMTDGVMSASFQTDNDEATRLLSHSLSQLKHVLEGQGVTVEKLQVQQAPRDQQSHLDDDSRQQQQQQRHEEHHSARQEQQRREMLRRMWRRLSGGQDPLDLVA